MSWIARTVRQALCRHHWRGSRTVDDLKVCTKCALHRGSFLGME